MTEILLIFVVLGISIILGNQRKQKDNKNNSDLEYQKGFKDGLESAISSMDSKEDDA